MQIGQAAAASGVSAKMIRHYEAIGLVAPAERSQANYRAYGASDVQRLAFVRRARALGFSIPQIRELLRLWSDHHRSSAEVKRITLAHVAELDRRIADLRAMADTLHELADACCGDKRADCPIITSLEGPALTPTRRNRRGLESRVVAVNARPLV
ncbi:Cu(I)-responsive transcriptional regulator [Lichenihabitans sp. Uapishka_5]|uniref:Cu(I)-responsive transcriptional regulator n=1 Tax=Lichenihabitans sp. Uapishka_5 TaxID=3037302 RepID=UPI0029E80DD9|nr:Cu(I)-responsive transcriptional regulator [Lichenihabitans sp. Uapishka_5]MDX7949784.1 Cu(I)-responsive transcriptional regulator [Lichenihabitans sp. Uapishka_5]